jgi:hypothetical protein
MSVVFQGLIYSFNKNCDYALRLVADLADDQMVSQPVCSPAVIMNHPAWILSHLNVYLPIIDAIIQNKEFEDPKPHRFGMQSKPESDRGLYASKSALVGEFESQHRQIVQRLQNADLQMLENSVKLPRWQELMPVAGIALPYLMILHENQHLGQLSAWRRALGLPSV